MIEAGNVAGAATAETGSTKEKKVMNIEEFRKRTEKHLAANEIANYGENYEPAYMACNHIDKDTFCKMLKSPEVNLLVCELSIAITALRKERDDAEKDAHQRIIELEGLAHTLEQAFDTAKDALSLISSNCDRALSSLGKFSFAAGVAATH